MRRASVSQLCMRLVIEHKRGHTRKNCYVKISLLRGQKEAKLAASLSTRILITKNSSHWRKVLVHIGVSKYSLICERVFFKLEIFSRSPIWRLLNSWSTIFDSEAIGPLEDKD